MFSPIWEFIQNNPATSTALGTILGALLASLDHFARAVAWLYNRFRPPKPPDIRAKWVPHRNSMDKIILHNEGGRVAENVALRLKSRKQNKEYLDPEEQSCPLTPDDVEKKLPVDLHPDEKGCPLKAHWNAAKEEPPYDGLLTWKDNGEQRKEIRLYRD